MKTLGPINPNFTCIIKNPVKPKKLKSKKYSIKVKGTWMEGFTRGKDGKDRPNGIRFFLPK